MKLLSVLICCIFWSGCVGNMPVPTNDFCSADTDCVPAQCCHATSCVAASAAPNCSDAICTLECRPGSLDCGGKCTCVEKRCSAQIAVAHTKESCEAQGGSWQRRFVGEFCNFPANDSGKSCTSGEQCEGDCLAADGSATSGKCSEYKTVYGCVTQLENGQPVGVCVD